MKYEVTWTTYKQCVISEQCNNLDEAMELYERMKVDLNTIHIKIAVILDEHNRS